jgi:3'-5' exoribonuclease
MPKLFVDQLEPNQEIQSHFILTDKQLRTARNGKAFLTAKLADRSGEIVARAWDNADELFRALPVKGPVWVQGRTEVFKEELQLQVLRLIAVPVDHIDPRDFVPVGPVSAEVLLPRLKTLMLSIERRPLRQLVNSFLQDESLMSLFEKAPAAKSMHHAYLGGLLEHTTSVTELVARFCEHYSDLDRDLLVVGAFLHDMGKIHEFTYEWYIDYSDAGRLLGHMLLGAEILNDKCRTLRNFPSEESILLKHLILSHHGTTEFGAVRVPMTREALALHFADDLDAKMASVNKILSDPRDGGAPWTPYQPMFDRYFLRSLPKPTAKAFDSNAPQESSQGRQLNLWPPEPSKGR